MPDRIVRQDILTSDRVNRLSDSAEKFYRRLMSVADDYGRFDGRPSIIRASCYQLQLHRVKDSDIKKWMLECAHEDVLTIYEVDNKPYVEIKNFKQRLRIMKSKYPPWSSADIRGHMTADVDSCQSETKRNEVESETESEEKRNEVRAPAVPAVKNVFIKPDKKELRSYFMILMGDSTKPVCWPEDKCFIEADTLLDHYTANGWVQARGKPIKDWKAACRNWIRNKLNGNFSPINGNKKHESENFVPKNGKTVHKPDESVHKTDRVAEEIEFLFARFKENPENVTLMSTDIYQYDYLKKYNRVSFSPDKAGEISEAAQKIMREKKIPDNPDIQKSYMKKLGILEFFKQLKETGAEAVFNAQN